MNVESLDLRGVWLRNSSRESFVIGIRKLRNLRKLSIPYVANDDVHYTWLRREVPEPKRDNLPAWAKGGAVHHGHGGG